MWRTSTPKRWHLPEPEGVFTLSLASVDADCMLAIRPRNATNITLAFSRFELGTFSNLRVYDGLSIVAPLIAVLRSTDSPRSITSQGAQRIAAYGRA